MATEGVHDPYPKISHSDSERVSQQLSVILDVEDLIPAQQDTRWRSVRRG